MELTKSNKSNPKQWEIWWFDPDPVKGNELGKKVRPAVIVSCNTLNDGPSGLVIIVPMTSQDRKILSHIRIEESDVNGRLEAPSFAACEQVRSVSKVRLKQKIGKIQNQSKVRKIHSWILDFIWIEG